MRERQWMILTYVVKECESIVLLCELSTFHKQHIYTETAMLINELRLLARGNVHATGCRDGMPLAIAS
jgi:hypothetical protein